MKKVMITVIATGVSVFSFAGLNKTAQVKTAASSTANTGSKKTLATTGEVKNDVKKSATVNAGTSVSSSSQAQTQTGNAGSNADLNTSSDANAGATVNVNGGKLIDKTESAANATTKATVETAQAVKGQASSEIKSDVKAVKQTVSSAKPDVNTSVAAETKTATQASVNNK